MNRKAFRVIGVFVLIMLLGTTVYAKSVAMVKVDRILAPKPDQALIIFMRPSKLGYAISSSIFDVSTNETKFIGVFKAGVKVGYDVAPGEYTFMVVGESADFMKATVSAEKTYYALVTPRMGAMKARFSFQPLHQADLESSGFSKWDSQTSSVENTPETEEWAKQNAADIEQKRARYWLVWSKKSLEEQNEQTLMVEDGR